MNINEFENNLNNHEADLVKLLNRILASNIKNQALNEQIIELQLQLLKSIDKTIDFDILARQIADRLSKRVIEIQIELTSTF